jgi:hypothetical protein
MSTSEFERFSDRFFRLSALYAEPGWYFKVRSGTPVGPYETRTEAEEASRNYAYQCQQSYDMGGRAPEQSFAYAYN